MALAALLAEPKRGRTLCKVGLLLFSLGNEDTAVLSRALENPRFTSREIAAALKQEGHSVGKTTIQDHRSRACCCADSDWDSAKERP